MEITRDQAAAILGVTKYRIMTMIGEGRIAPCILPKPGATRFVMKFDEAAVRGVKRSLAGETNGHLFTPPPEAPPNPSALSIVLALAQVEADKRELLLKIAQRYTAHELALLAGL
jgi:hypothetical protein